MTRNTLVSPLGRSPGAVSGVFYGLRAKGISVDKVITVGTSHPDIIRAAKGYLAPLFHHEEVNFRFLQMPGQDDLRSEEHSVLSFTGRIGLAIQNEATDEHNRVHVAVTGGRAGMGALAALAGQLYGATKLWHIWVPAEIEQKGSLEHLDSVDRDVGRLTSGQEMAASHILNPTIIDETTWDLVSLPFIDLRPLHPLIKDYHRTGNLPDLENDILTRLLVATGVERFTQIFPAGMTFAQAEKVMKIAGQYHQASSAQEKNQLLRKLTFVLANTGVIDASESDKLLSVLTADGSVETLRAMIKEDATGFLKWMPQDKEELEVLEKKIGLITQTLTASMTTATFLLSALELWLKVQGLVP
jgi:hypothetical protein